MAKLTIELPFNYDEQDYNLMLSQRKLTHLSKHGVKCTFKAGDALRSEKGVIARIVERFVNYENYSTDLIIANNQLSWEEMNDHFNCHYHPEPKNEVNSQGLRYVSPEVGWVDEDEEYR